MARQRGSVSRFRGRWRVRLWLDGVRTLLGIYDDEGFARQVLADALAATRPTAPDSLVAWGRAWLDTRELSPAHRGVERERRLWRSRVESAPFARLPLRQIDTRAIRAWAHDSLASPARRVVQVRGGGTREMERSATTSRQTVVNALNLLRVCLRAAVDAGRLDANPAESVRVPRVARAEDPWTYLDASELDRVLAANPHAAHVVALLSGLRKGELWGLRWSDVVLDGDAPRLRVARSYRGPTKGGRAREVPLLEPARLALRTWRLAHPGVAHALVFPADGGGPHDVSYSAGWSDLLARAGITRRVRFHDARHTCASHLLMGTWAPHWIARPLRLEEVQQWLGHASRTTTERYAHLAPEGLRGLLPTRGTTRVTRGTGGDA